MRSSSVIPSANCDIDMGAYSTSTPAPHRGKNISCPSCKENLCHCKRRLAPLGRRQLSKAPDSTARLSTDSSAKWTPTASLPTTSSNGTPRHQRAGRPGTLRTGRTTCAIYATGASPRQGIYIEILRVQRMCKRFITVQMGGAQRSSRR